MIVLLPSSRESMGDLMRRWNAMGYSLSNRGMRLVAEPMRSNVVPLKRRSAVAAIFDFANRERT
jgi:hypothetical protein